MNGLRGSGLPVSFVLSNRVLFSEQRSLCVERELGREFGG